MCASYAASTIQVRDTLYAPRCSDLGLNKPFKDRIVRYIGKKALKVFQHVWPRFCELLLNHLLSCVYGAVRSHVRTYDCFSRGARVLDGGYSRRVDARRWVSGSS